MEAEPLSFPEDPEVSCAGAVESKAREISPSVAAPTVTGERDEKHEPQPDEELRPWVPSKIVAISDLARDDARLPHCSEERQRQHFFDTRIATEWRTQQHSTTSRLRTSVLRQNGTLPLVTPEQLKNMPPATELCDLHKNDCSSIRKHNLEHVLCLHLCPIMHHVAWAPATVGPAIRDASSVHAIGSGSSSSSCGRAPVGVWRAPRKTQEILESLLDGQTNPWHTYSFWSLHTVMMGSVFMYDVVNTLSYAECYVLVRRIRRVEAHATFKWDEWEQRQKILDYDHLVDATVNDTITQHLVPAVKQCDYTRYCAAMTRLSEQLARQVIERGKAHPHIQRIMRLLSYKANKLYTDDWLPLHERESTELEVKLPGDLKQSSDDREVALAKHASDKAQALTASKQIPPHSVVTEPFQFAAVDSHPSDSKQPPFVFTPTPAPPLSSTTSSSSLSPTTFSQHSTSTVSSVTAATLH